MFRVVFMVGYDEFEDDDIIQYSAEEFNSIEEAVKWYESLNNHLSFYIEEDVSTESLQYFGCYNVSTNENDRGSKTVDAN